ncbi:MAG: hypothetical protein SPK18_11940 [Treponema sp.]|nr:hypothetical protein [Spirochaetia bacterium]MDD7535062.1 hypothetical protein [Treponema sp.]MDY5759279.1 hypothetical protein [Treponema sp.]MDY5819188.1 hypothetical protein [Treponema sp.]
MKTIESFNVLESFGMKNGLFEEVSEVEMSDVIGGSCGGGTGCFIDCYVSPCGGKIIV